MSTSGIGPSAELTYAFSDAIDSGSVRFLKISISNESLVPDASISPSGTFQEDLAQLSDILEDDVPAYVLARLDNPEWLAIFYVPDSAKVRDKMLYASTRNSVTKSLGSAHFTDSIFATSKQDLTAEAYNKHKLHMAAPKPLSAREKSLADLAAAEKEAGQSAYQGSSVRTTLIPPGVGMDLSEEDQALLTDLAEGSILTFAIDTTADESRNQSGNPPLDTLKLIRTKLETNCDVNNLGSNLPRDHPSYAFFALPSSLSRPSQKEVVFIYSCPSSSPVQSRMKYSFGSSTVLQNAKELLSNHGRSLFDRKVETSDPTELNEAFFKEKLGLPDGAPSAIPFGSQAFARPKGPGRKR